MPTETETEYKWQPVVLIVLRRLDCERCGAMAVFVELEPDVRLGVDGYDTTAYCQPCFEAYQAEP